AYVGYLSGRSAVQTSDTKTSSSLLTFSHGLAFVLGFSVVFVLLGALAAAVGALLFSITSILVRVGGVVVVIFGLHMTGLFRIKYLDYDLRPQNSPDRRRSYVSSALMGMFFSAGWAPCVGPVLGAILTLALNGASVLDGAGLLTAYSAGLAIPFLLAATQVGWVSTILHRYGRVMIIVEKGMGVVLIGLGILLFSGRFSTLASLGTFFDYFDEIFVGRLLLLGLVAAAILGLVPALVAKTKGKRFVDWWFLGTGLSFVLIIALYAIGLFDFVLPFIVTS
ncbi:MAG: hypothetical protein HND51_24350, partial [Chloroflexi bacterium]|nr:hypothetical protein [Chloroflexota bacterium]NOH14780.1 hypothetical protein [Chloroflexota bacterium]